MTPAEPRLLLVRHGESTWNRAGRWQGQADPPLSAAGRGCAAARVETLAPSRFDLVASSDLARARETAEILAAGLGLDAPVLDARLRERDAGAWAGLTDAEIAARWPGQPAAWRAADDAGPPGAVEDKAGAVARLFACLSDLLDRFRDSRLLVVSHGGVVRALAERCSGRPVEPLGNLDGVWLRRTSSTLEVV